MRSEQSDENSETRSSMRSELSEENTEYGTIKDIIICEANFIRLTRLAHSPAAVSPKSQDACDNKVNFQDCSSCSTVLYVYREST